jgi:hypothetical protein
MPSLYNVNFAVTIRPLVAIAHGVPTSVRYARRSRAPGSGRTFEEYRT